MFSTDLPEVLAAQVLFWALLPFVLFAPPRWAILGWLIMGNLDATGPGQSTSAAMGLINAAKGVAIPLYLWWRLRGTSGTILASIPARFWLLLTAYASIAIIWAQFPMAAVKLVGNMIGILVSLVILEKAARRQYLDRMALIALIVVSLTLGVVQTYYYGGASYGYDGADQPSRFSSFVAAQQYAAFLVAFLALVLWHRGLPISIRAAFCVALSVALVLNGSRVWFFGAIAVMAVYSWLRFRRVVAITAFGAAAATLLVMLLINMNTAYGIELDDSSNRIVGTVSALLTGSDTSHSVGLRDLTFRSRIYQGVLDDMRESSVWEIVFGHGTSTGGSAVLRAFPSSYRSEEMDPNRTIHNEWLRAVYEWGAVGLALLAASLGSLFIGLVVTYRNGKRKQKLLPALSFLPAFLAAFSTENVLAGAGNAVTMSLALTVALLWSQDPSI